MVRETALTLIRRHYERLGGATRLAWLMESPHREVGLFTVRLLWEQRRPQPPSAAVPQTVSTVAQPAAESLAALDELRQFLRKTCLLYTSLPDKLEQRAFDDAWKISPAPLLRLLEDARNAQVCTFAIRSLEQDFGDALRHVEPAWLSRIGAKQLAIVDEFVLKLLRDNPEFHQSKLKALGLHEMVPVSYTHLTGAGNAGRPQVDSGRDADPDPPPGRARAELSDFAGRAANRAALGQRPSSLAPAAIVVQSRRGSPRCLFRSTRRSGETGVY